MRDFEDSTLWRISAFDRIRQESGGSAFMRLSGPTVLPTTLLADLRRLDADPQSSDMLEVVAACIRHREPALLCLQHEELVWPVTLFPEEGLYHSPRDLAAASIDGLSRLRLLTAEPPGVRPPGHWMHERVGLAEMYRPLPPLLWLLALQGPRRELLADIAGPAAYRFVPTGSRQHPQATGALRSAVDRLLRESATVREMARWPGMSEERANRALNGLYLSGQLLVTRARAAADAAAGTGMFGRRKRS